MFWPQVFIETLLDRAEWAERLLLGQDLLTRDHPEYLDPFSPQEVLLGPGRGGRSLDGSDDDIITHRMQEAIGNRVGDQNQNQNPVDLFYCG